MKNYQCGKCAVLIQNAATPSPFNCPKGGNHQWSDLGEVGSVNYQCRKCALLLHSKASPSPFGCTAGGNHQWNKL
jgi:hypothetical protein